MTSRLYHFGAIVLLAAFLLLYLANLIGSSQPAWVEIQPGVGQNALCWHPSAAAERFDADKAVISLPDGASHVLIRLESGSQLTEQTFFRIPDKAGGQWTRVNGSTRVHIDPASLAISVDFPHRTVFPRGLLAMVQVLFLPGFLILKHFKFRSPPLSTLVFSFGLSLVFNSYLVMILWTFKINGPIALWIVIALEMLFLALRVRPEHWDAIGAFARLFQNIPDLRRYLREVALDKRLFWLAAAAGALAVLIWATGLAGRTAGEVFTNWDAVHSWNRWAIDFASNTRFTGGLYPQLLPKNISIPYTLIGNTNIALFSRGIMPFFALAIFLGMFELGLVTKNPGYFVALPVSALLFHACLGDLITAGYADLPVAFFCFAGIQALLLGNMETTAEERIQSVYLASVFFAGAGLTKQAGLYLLIAGPLLSWFLLIANDKKLLPGTERKNTLIRSGFLTLALTVPGYAFNLLLLALGKMDNNLVLLTQTIHKGRNAWERLMHSYESLCAALGPARFWIIYPGTILCARVPGQVRVLVLGIVIPYFLIWGLLFSYDLRNFTFSIPATALAFGLGLAAFAGMDKHSPVCRPNPPSRTDGATRRIPLINGWTLVGAAIVLTLAASGTLHDDRLQAINDQASMRIIFPDLNDKLAKSCFDGTLTGPLVTNVYQTSQLTIIKDLLANRPEDNPLHSLATLRPLLEESDARSLLYRPERALAPDAADFLEQLIINGQWKVAWDFTPANSDMTYRLLVKRPASAASGP